MEGVNMLWIALFVIAMIIIIFILKKVVRVSLPDSDRSRDYRYKIQPVDQGVLSQNNYLIKEIFHYMEIIIKILTMKDIMPQDWKLFSISLNQNHNTVTILCMFGLDFLTTPDYSQISQQFSHYFKEEAYKENVFFSYETIEEINGDSKIFFRELGKELSNVYPNIEYILDLDAIENDFVDEFSDSLSGFIDGSDGKDIALSNRSTFEQRCDYQVMWY